MEIKVNQSKLRKALSVVSRVASSGRNAMPILTNVLLEANKNQLILTATNLELAIVENIGVEVIKEGKITVPARLLADFVANLPKNEDVVIKEKDGKLLVNAGRYKSTINTMNAEDFPELPDIDEKKAVIYRIEKEKFQKSVAQVLIAVSNDMTRPILTGVFFNTSNNSLFIAATDGYRLVDKEILNKTESDVKAVVPAPALQEVQKSISDDTEEIEILFAETQVRFRLDEIEITSKLIDGSYPDYRQLIPKDTEINLDLDKIALERMTRVAALFAQNSSGSIICEAIKEEKKFKVSAVASEVGENSSDIEVNEIEKDGKVVLNSRFLLDALNSTEENEINFCFSGNLSPVVIRGKNNDKYVHIIMPLKS
jgi:DNA polymerase-3 subunit beta